MAGVEFHRIGLGENRRRKELSVATPQPELRLYPAKALRRKGFREKILFRTSHLGVLAGENSSGFNPRPGNENSKPPSYHFGYAPAGWAPAGGRAVSLGFGWIFKAQVAAIIAINPPTKKAIS